MIDFIPTTRAELNSLGWTHLDVILISGDTYIDSSYSGVSVVGKLLIKNGFKVAIIAQPDIKSDKDIKRLGEPELFWGVTGGCVDSMVANYTATKKFRQNDDFTPAVINNRRPDRAVIKYSNLIRQYFKDTVPIVLGGIEASLRRVTHYDFWSNKIRKSILFDAKADIILYGMAEKSVVELAKTLRNREDYRVIKGLCYISKDLDYIQDDYILMPSFDEVSKDKDKFIDMFHIFYANNDPITAKGIYQKNDTRYYIQNPPQEYLNRSEMDEVYDLNFQRDVHPFYKKQGRVKALETITFSINTHQGCYGECNFCAITVHQGKTIRSRSKNSILKEVDGFIKDSRFKGIISDVGGATANMYDYECDKKLTKGSCNSIRCTGFKIFSSNKPSNFKICPQLKPNHKSQIELLKSIRETKGVKKVFVNSGIRYDLIQEDKSYGQEYLKNIVNHHISGQMKIAPEHTEDKILKLMGKPNKQSLIDFKRSFDALNKSSNKKQFLTYYLIAGHPACTESDMRDLKSFTSSTLKINPEQVQIFTPTPSTYSTLMYYTKIDPFTKKPIFVEQDIARKEKQKNIVVNKNFGYKKKR